MKTPSAAPKSRTELEQNLGYMKHTGIFAVLLEDIDPYETKSALIVHTSSFVLPSIRHQLADEHRNLR